MPEFTESRNMTCARKSQSKTATCFLPAVKQCSFLYLFCREATAVQSLPEERQTVDGCIVYTAPKDVCHSQCAARRTLVSSWFTC